MSLTYNSSAPQMKKVTSTLEKVISFLKYFNMPQEMNLDISITLSNILELVS